MNIYDKWQQAALPDMPEWNRDEMWYRIEQQLPPRRKRRRAIWFWLWGGALLLSLGIFAHQHKATVRSRLQPSGHISHPPGQRSPQRHTTEPNTRAAIPSPQDTSSGAYAETAPTAAEYRSDNAPDIVPAGKSIPSAETHFLTETGAKPPLRTLGNRQKEPVPELLSVAPRERIMLKNIEKKPTFSPIDVVVVQQSTLPRRELMLAASYMSSYGPVKARRPETSAYATALQQAVTPLETVVWEGNIVHHFNPSWGVISGIQWQRSAFWFRHTDIQKETTQVPSDSAVYFNINGVNYYGSGTLTQDQTTTTRIISPTVLHQWFVPVMTFYQKRYPRHTFRVSGGILLNVWSKYEGYTLDNQLKPTRDRQQITSIYRSGGAHGISAGWAVERLLGRRWGVFLEGRGQYSLRSVLKNDTGIMQNPVRGGIVLGCTYRAGVAR